MEDDIQFSGILIGGNMAIGLKKVGFICAGGMLDVHSCISSIFFV